MFESMGWVHDMYEGHTHKMVVRRTLMGRARTASEKREKLKGAKFY